MTAASVAQFITILILFFVVLGSAFFVTRWISNYQKNAGNSGFMEVVEVCRISVSQVLEVVRIGEGYVVIAVSKDTVEMIRELAPGEYSPGVKSAGHGQSFRELLDQLKRKPEDNGADRNV